MDNPIIELKHLSIGYKGAKQDTTLYNDINAELHEGSLTCLLGKNGSGKSTLLRSICALLPSLGGDILLAGKSLNKYTIGELAQLISIVLTDKVRVDDMSAYELIELGRSPYSGFWGKLGKEDYKIIDDAIELIGIADIAHRKVQSLSDGERQKVMIAKAVVQETPIILLDEPSAFLDFASKIKLMQLLKSLTRNFNKTILLSTHDLEHALKLADFVWLMDKGLGFTKGPSAEVCKNGTISKYFGMDGVIFNAETYRFEIETETRQI